MSIKHKLYLIYQVWLSLVLLSTLNYCVTVLSCSSFEQILKGVLFQNNGHATKNK